ncbi:hypothetical protein ACIQUS_25770 [Pseudomonas sp. NPDC090755]|uniref:hypothetical protein n=1 Tax=Pseudomonas sp. NPDC090755 TaxID=3364481 RepID=UPI003839F5E6
MKNVNRSFISVIFSFWFLSCFSVFLSSVVAVALYRDVFSGGFSGRSSDWGDFGGYIGGVFGPLISFVTLLAVLKTVYLQRELLDAQNKEFERMNQLQRDTFNAQLQQIQGASDDSRKLQISASRDTAIKVIEQQIILHERVFDRKNEYLMKNLKVIASSSGGPERETYDRVVRERGIARRSADALLALSVKIATTDYLTVNDVRHELVSGFQKIETQDKK